MYHENKSGTVASCGAISMEFDKGVHTIFHQNRIINKDIKILGGGVGRGCEHF